MINDINAERVVLASILKYGQAVFYDVNSLVSENDFTLPENRLLYSVFVSLVTKQSVNILDSSLICQEISKIDKSLLGKYDIIEYLNQLLAVEVSQENSDKFAKMVARCALLRNLDTKLSDVKNYLKTTSYDQPVIEIISEAERVFLDFNSKLMAHTDDTISIGDSIKSLMEEIATTKPQQLGIPTGFPLFDQVIGGGIRSPGVAVVGGRAGSGKSSLAINIGINVALNKIKILYLDTELTSNIIMCKIMARMAQLDIKDIETGRFADNMESSKKIDDAIKKLENIGFYYRNISGFQHHQTISVIRRWINKHVGFDENGNLKPCLIILDYIKMMDVGELKNIQEYQYLGQYITDLHNFCVPLKLPIIAMVQLNRDGIEKENSSAISGSDRIVWLCTSFSIFKKKSAEDFVSDPITNGDRKLIVDKVRFGPGLEFGEYINIKTDLGKCTIIEGHTNLSNKSIQNNKPTRPVFKPEKIVTAVADDNNIDF